MDNKLLVDAEKNKTYIIKKINIENDKLNLALKNIGFVVGEHITIKAINYGKKSLLVSVMGVNFGLDKKISEKVEVVSYE